MNIAIDIRSLMNPKRTGVGEYTLELLSAIFSIDKKNEYYLFYNSAKPVSIPDINYPNVHLVKFSWPNKLLNTCLKIFTYPKLDKLINKKFNTKIDLFFFPNIIFLATQCPYIITCHDLSFELFPHFFSCKRQLWHKIINPQKLFSQASKIIAVSNNTKTDLINSYTLNQEKITVIHSGLSSTFNRLDLSDPGKERIRQKYKLPSKFFLYLGTLEPRKNIESLIQAFNIYKQDHHSSTDLVIAGTPGWKYRSIYQAAKQSNFSNKIHFIDYVDDHDKIYLYNLAEKFIFPSYYEGFGFPPLEALACGTPVISSHTSSLPEILQTHATYIDPYNINDLASALGLELSKPTSLPITYSWNNTAQKLLDLFNQKH
ncbi:hypothetical protein COT97_01855 [Candidatus Falkowbacteria bacterium CG10_big_fil_rev_8_21_14_0_10_39_11]|uniref:Glycosyltransferase family 1 protein n=1 Tax=Candidatus Falkowbacteria bacterium CG10_big_fil_rev_8_21_14_0_10_39_11 TaxID=1974565 RepID=A0A2H0V5E9_9BACT|nr:MAG: hypothetical protein COT97_01855 [Candidatus Falkowbacteria bacterium CG10_big_fil_rev_8_21_14_0_10_39_11]